jgi:hypothetical protein
MARNAPLILDRSTGRLALVQPLILFAIKYIGHLHAYIHKFLILKFSSIATVQDLAQIQQVAFDSW